MVVRNHFGIDRKLASPKQFEILQMDCRTSTLTHYRHESDRFPAGQRYPMGQVATAAEGNTPILQVITGSDVDAPICSRNFCHKSASSSAEDCAL